MSIIILELISMLAGRTFCGQSFLFCETTNVHLLLMTKKHLQISNLIEVQKDPRLAYPLVQILAATNLPQNMSGPLRLGHIGRKHLCFYLTRYLNLESIDNIFISLGI